MYSDLLKEVDTTFFLLIPLKIKAFAIKHDKILQLAQAGYATEVSKEKASMQYLLTYLRERVKNDTTLSQNAKKAYSDTFEIEAGKIFEKNGDLKAIRTALTKLHNQDMAITKDIEAIHKEALRIEIAGYKKTCDDLYIYFSEKNSPKNHALAAECINGEEREKVFASMYKAIQAKQQLIQEEQYALAVKKKEEEHLSIVPPALRQDGKVIVVNLSLQRLYAYENGKSIFDSAVLITTGKYGFETVTGEFAIFLKEQQHKMVSPFPGIYYDDVVNYWMPFYLGYGLHDAPWRSVYGTQDYPVVGSHGCVNMPLKDVIVLYNWAEVGTRVVVI